MWQNTCSAQQHCHTARQWGFSHSNVESNSHSNGKQHSSTTITSIHLTSTRQRGTFPSNINGTNESTQATAWKQLQHTTHKQTSHHAMDGKTRSLPAEQVCNTCRWQHQLLQTLEQGTQDTNLWIWWNSSIHIANSKTNAKDGSQILSSNLAWQRHLNKWKTSWASQTKWSDQEPSEHRSSLRSTTSNCWMSSTTHRWQLQQHQALFCYRQQRWWQDHRRQQRHKHLFKRKNHFLQRQHNQQHLQANRRPSQTCRWQQHHQHKEQEHPCQCQPQKETRRMK